MTAIAVSLVTTACGATQGVGENAQAGAGTSLSNMGNTVNTNDIPINQRFGNLDEYLAFLESTQATVDGPWYRQVGPDVYELQSGGNLHDDAPVGAAQRTFTRDELERKFGFRN